MSESWFILTTRYGEDIRDPSDESLASAIDEVADPTQAADTEHGAASVRFGSDDDGPMYLLEYSVGRRLRFEQWADPDFEDELFPAVTREAVSPDEARQMMKQLRAGGIDEVRKVFCVGL